MFLKKLILDITTFYLLFFFLFLFLRRPLLAIYASLNVTTLVDFSKKYFCHQMSIFSKIHITGELQQTNDEREAYRTSMKQNYSYFSRLLINLMKHCVLEIISILVLQRIGILKKTWILYVYGFCSNTY